MSSPVQVTHLDFSETGFSIRSLAARIPDFKILDGATYLPDSGNIGPVELPISFTPTLRRLP